MVAKVNQTPVWRFSLSTSLLVRYIQRMLGLGIYYGTCTLDGQWLILFNNLSMVPNSGVD